MFLDYLALGMLFFVIITLLYIVIVIHDIPYEIAKHRDHPHQDAIHAPDGSACSRGTRSGRSCGSGRWRIGRNGAGASAATRRHRSCAGSRPRWCAWRIAWPCSSAGRGEPD